MPLSKLTDYHLHTRYTIDGRMTEQEACQCAHRLNLREIAFTNHSMLTEPDYFISLHAFQEHWKQIQICQESYPELTIRLGLEVDYYEGLEGEVAESIKRYEDLIGRPFDLILGSVHHLHGVFFSSKLFAGDLYRNHDIVTLYQDYFDLAIKAVNSRIFDVMAHPDLIKKFAHEYSNVVPFEKYITAAELFVDALLSSGVGLEVNTKGLDERKGEAFPSDALLNLYLSKAKSITRDPIITLGSDAHQASDVGKNLMEGAMILRRLGCRSIMHFEKRKPTLVLI